MKADSSLCRAGILCILRHFLCTRGALRNTWGAWASSGTEQPPLPPFTTKTRNATSHICRWDSQREAANVMDLSESQSDFWWSCLWKTTSSTCSFWMLFKTPEKSIKCLLAETFNTQMKWVRRLHYYVGCRIHVLLGKRCGLSGNLVEQ